MTAWDGSRPIARNALNRFTIRKDAMSQRRTKAGSRSGSARHEGPDSPAAPSAGDGAPAVPDSTRLRDLLESYVGLLNAVEEQRRQAGLPRRVWVWATNRATTERIRRGLGALERRYRERRALGGPLDTSTADDGARVAELAAALPAPPSRIRLIWLVVGILVLAQIVLGVAQDVLPSAAAVGTLKHAGSPSAAALPSFPSSDELAPLVAVVDELSAAFPGDIGRLADIVLKTSVLATSVVLTILGVAAYVVLRPLASGATAARILCYGSAKRKRWSVYTDEHRRAAVLRIREREQAVFAPNGMDAPADSRADLLVKAYLAASVLVIAAGLWHMVVGEGNIGSEGGYGLGREVAFTRIGPYPPAYAWLAVTAASLAVVRLTWLARELHRREVGRRPPGSTARGPSPLRTMLAYAVPLVAVTATFALYAVPDRKAPSVWVVAPRSQRVLDVPQASLAVFTGGNRAVKREVERGVVELRYACDEPCRISAARFLQPGQGFARPWPRDTAGDVEDRRDPNQELVRDEVKEHVTLDVAPGVTRTATWRFDASPRGQPLWPRLHKGQIVAELRFVDMAGNSTTVPLWWGYWECEAQEGQAGQISGRRARWPLTRREGCSDLP